MRDVTIDEALNAAGTGAFQRRLFLIFGLVWTADAMQVLSIGFTAPSIAKTFGLSLPVALQTGTIFFVGMLIGAALFGRLADRIGRRNLLIVTVLLDALFGLASAFASDFTMLLIFRFITGLAVGGTLPVDYAMMAEFLPANRRGRWLVGLEGFWAVGTVIVALAAWYAAANGMADGWRFIFVITALPALIGLALRFWVPESPFYLLKNGKAAEAKTVLDRIATTNGKPVLAGKLTETREPRLPLSALFSGPYARRSYLILAAWLLVSISYYGIFVWLPGKLVSAGEHYGFLRGYGFLVLLALAQIPGYALAAYGVERWGRKPTLIAFLLLSAVGCFLYAVLADPTAVGAAMMLMSFALLGTWGALYAFTPELYPTALRASGMGLAGAMARLGGLLAPTVVGAVVTYSFNVALGLFAAILLLGAIATAAIDVETKQKPLT
ncbi:MAG: MFS transporter [Candidatus Kaistia colombiensis]|nr:MAG: MFS transporter [Kaistia sp.]